MDVARLNFSHQTIDWHRERVAMIRGISAEAGRPIGILQDLPGPKIRVGNFPDGPVELKVGQEFTLTADAFVLHCTWDCNKGIAPVQMPSTPMDIC